jgi:hypothetical protein
MKEKTIPLLSRPIDIIFIIFFIINIVFITYVVDLGIFFFLLFLKKFLKKKKNRTIGN